MGEGVAARKASTHSFSDPNSEKLSSRCSSVSIHVYVCMLKFYTQMTGTGDHVTRRTTRTQLQCGVVWSKTVKVTWVGRHAGQSRKAITGLGPLL
jgi:hypothetical protein